MSEVAEREGATGIRCRFHERKRLDAGKCFCPWSQSRSFDAKIKDPLKRSLNWKVTLMLKGRAIVTCDYSAGIGHAPCYKASKRLPGGGVSLHDEALFIGETETGFVHGVVTRNSDRKRPINPEPADVLSSLVMDSNVLDYSSFEQWAPSLVMILTHAPPRRFTENVWRTHSLCATNSASHCSRNFATLFKATEGLVMKTKNTRKAQVHRFNDSVAIWIGGGACTYISAGDARALALALTGAATDVESAAPTKSAFTSRSFDFEPTEESSWQD